MIPVQETSRKAYHELKAEGKITGRQALAFETIQEFYEEKGYWPTPKEVHAFLAVEKAHELAQFEGPNMVKPRITELIIDPDDNDPDLLEKESDSRKQEYIEELLNDYESKSANPVRIKGYQSTLSEKEGEAAELKKGEEESSESVSREVDGEEVEIEIPYQVENGDQVKMGSPVEAVRNTDDLRSVVQMLEKKNLLEKYQSEIEAARGSGSVEDPSKGQEVDSRGLVEKNGETYLFDPEDDSSEDSTEEQSASDRDVDDDSGEEGEQKLLFDKGEVVR